MNSSDLRKKIDNYIDKSISLLELEEWFVPRLPEYLANPDSQDSELIATLELALTEYSEGIHDDETVRKLMADALRREKITMIRVYNETELSTTASPTRVTKPMKLTQSMNVVLRTDALLAYST